MDNKHLFYQDEKVEVWQRHTFSVKADSRQKAEAFIRENGLANGIEWHDNDFDGRVEFDQTETMFETSDTMTVEDNGGFPTIEIITPDKKSVADNCGNRNYLAESGLWRDRAIELIKKNFAATDEKATEFADRRWANNTPDKDNLFEFDVWLHGGESLKTRGQKELCVFLSPLEEFDRYATDGEIVAAFESRENADRKLPVEKITPDEFACLCNDEEFADQQYWVRFINY